jgi:hypothetical protein
MDYKDYELKVRYSTQDVFLSNLRIGNKNLRSSFGTRTPSQDYLSIRTRAAASSGLASAQVLHDMGLSIDEEEKKKKQTVV